MQAALPDLNTAIIRYRILIISCLEQDNYSGAIGGLYALNALLPEEYRVKVSTDEYDRLIKTDIFIKCKHCFNEFDFYKIRVFNLNLTNLEMMISGKKYEKVWICPDCKKDNRLISSEMKKTQISTNTFLHVMPDPPNREMGIQGRTEYHNAMNIWTWTFLGELEERCGKLRHDFLNREENVLEEITDEA